MGSFGSFLHEYSPPPKIVFRLSPLCSAGPLKRLVLVPVLEGFNTINHSRIALLLGGAKGRFKRTHPVVSRGEAIKWGSSRLPSDIDPVQCQ